MARGSGHKRPSPRLPGRIDPTGRIRRIPEGGYHFEAACGEGAEAIIQRARAEPHKHFLGADPELSEGALRAAERLENLRLVRAKAQEVLRILPPSSISAARMEFFLASDEARGGDSRRILELLRRRLRPGGELRVVHSKHAEADSKELVRKNGFEPSESRPVDPSLPMSRHARMRIEATRLLRKGAQTRQEAEILRRIRAMSNLEQHPDTIAPMEFVARVRRT